MLVELNECVHEFQTKYIVACKYLTQNKGKHFIDNSRFTEAGRDVLGGLQSLFASYVEFLPWSYENFNHFQSIATAYPIFDPTIVSKQLNNILLTKEEETSHAVWLELSRQALLMQVEQADRRINSGFLEAYNAKSALFRSNFKSFIYFVRAFQDAIYNCILNNIGAPAPVRPDMKKILTSAGCPKYDHQVATVLINVEGYFDWFSRFQLLRNEIKEGKIVNEFGSPPNIGINVTPISAEGGVTVDYQSGVTIKNVVEWVRINCAVIDKIVI